MLVGDHKVAREGHGAIAGEFSSTQPSAVDGYRKWYIVQIAEVNHDPPLLNKCYVGGCLVASSAKEKEIHFAFDDDDDDSQTEKDFQPGTVIAKLVRCQARQGTKGRYVKI